VGSKKIDLKMQTFNIDADQPNSGKTQSLPPIFKVKKKVQAMHLTSNAIGPSSKLQQLNATKKNFPQLAKLTAHKK
jgi:hypothetical protein